MFKKHLFTFQDTWPWALMLALIVGVSTQAILYARHHGFDQHGFFVLGLVVACLVAIIVVRFLLMAIVIEKWNNAFKIRLGAAVFTNDILNIPLRGIDSVCDDAAFYWKEWAIRNRGITSSNAQSLLASAFDGATIICRPQIIQRGTSLWTGKFLGIQEGQNIYVVYDKKIVVDDDSFLRLVKHEVSHLCLTALGVDPGNFGNLHHEIFAQTQYC
jgi:hypothetical protein